MLILNGILSLVVLIITLIRSNNNREWVIFKGVVLLGWIGFELILLSEFNLLEIIFALAIAAVLVSGIFLGKSKAEE